MSSNPLKPDLVTPTANPPPQLEAEFQFGALKNYSNTENESNFASTMPADERETKKLLRMANQETPEFVPSHASIVKWFDMLPLHYSALQIAGLQLMAFALNRDVIVLLFIFLAVSLPLLLYAIHRSSSLEDSIFESRLVLPHKLSYTRVIVKADLISSYRRWLKVKFSLIESYFLIIFISKFF